MVDSREVSQTELDKKDDLFYRYDSDDKKAALIVKRSQDIKTPFTVEYLHVKGAAKTYNDKMFLANIKDDMKSLDGDAEFVQILLDEMNGKKGDEVTAEDVTALRDYLRTQSKNTSLSPMQRAVYAALLHDAGGAIAKIKPADLKISAEAKTEAAKLVAEDKKIANEVIAEVSKIVSPDKPDEKLEREKIKPGDKEVIVKDSKGEDPTQELADSESAKKMIDDLLAKGATGSISMEKDLSDKDVKFNKEVQIVQALIQAVNYRDGVQRLDGLYQTDTLDAWNGIIGKKNSEGGYKDQYDEFKKAHNITGDMNSNQAAAFMIWLVQTNKPARYNTAIDIRRVSEDFQTVVSKANSPRYMKENDTQLFQLIANIFYGKDFAVRTDIRKPGNVVQEKPVAANSPTALFSTTLNDKYKSMDAYRRPNPDEPISKFGEKITNTVAPTVPTEVKKVMDYSGALNFQCGNPYNQAEAYNKLKDNKLSDKALGEYNVQGLWAANGFRGPFVELVGNNKLIMVEGPGKAYYLSSEFKDHEFDLIGIGSVPLGQNLMRRMLGQWDGATLGSTDYERLKAGMIVTIDIDKANRNLEIWIRKREDGKFEANILTDQIKEQNRFLLDAARLNTPAALASMRTSTGDRRLIGSFSEALIATQPLEAPKNEAPKNPNEQLLSSVKPGDLKKEFLGLGVDTEVMDGNGMRMLPQPKK